MHLYPFNFIANIEVITLREVTEPLLTFCSLAVSRYGHATAVEREVVQLSNLLKVIWSRYTCDKATIENSIRKVELRTNTDPAYNKLL